MPLAALGGKYTFALNNKYYKSDIIASELLKLLLLGKLNKPDNKLHNRILVPFTALAKNKDSNLYRLIKSIHQSNNLYKIAGYILQNYIFPILQYCLPIAFEVNDDHIKRLEELNNDNEESIKYGLMHNTDPKYLALKKELEFYTKNKGELLILEDLSPLDERIHIIENVCAECLMDIQTIKIFTDVLNLNASEALHYKDTNELMTGFKMLSNRLNDLVTIGNKKRLVLIIDTEIFSLSTTIMTGYKAALINILKKIKDNVIIDLANDYYVVNDDDEYSFMLSNIFRCSQRMIIHAQKYDIESSNSLFNNKNVIVLELVRLHSTHNIRYKYRNYSMMILPLLNRNNIKSMRVNVIEELRTQKDLESFTRSIESALTEGQDRNS